MLSNAVFLYILCGFVMSISLTKLNQLITVADLGSFSRAATELNLSQPALSRSIATLEERYGVRIFNRVGHGVEATASGRQVVAQARHLLRSLRVFEKNLQLHGRGEAGQLALGMGPLVASQMLPRLVPYLFETSPHIRVESRIRPGPALLQALRADTIEIFFCPSTQIVPSTDLQMEDIGYLSPRFIVRREHPLSREKGLVRRDIARFPVAAAVDIVPAMGADPSPPAFISDNFHILRDVVLRGDFVWLCSTGFIADEIAKGDLVELSVADHPLEPSMIVAATLTDRILSPLAERALAFMKGELSSTMRLESRDTR